MDVFSGIISIKVTGSVKSKTMTECLCTLFPGRDGNPPWMEIDKRVYGDASQDQIVILMDMKWMTKNCKPPKFQLRIQEKLYTFVTASKDDYDMWIVALCCVSQELFTCRYALSSIMGSNDLNDDESSFFVLLKQTSGSSVKGLRQYEGPYKLVVGVLCLKLCHLVTGAVKVAWKYELLRSFGHNPRYLVIEAGTRCASGEGQFVFHTPQAAHMFHLITVYLAKFKDRLHGQQRVPVTEQVAVSVVVKHDIVRPERPSRESTVSSFKYNTAESAAYEEPDEHDYSKLDITTYLNDLAILDAGPEKGAECELNPYQNDAPALPPRTYSRRTRQNYENVLLEDEGDVRSSGSAGSCDPDPSPPTETRRPRLVPRTKREPDALTQSTLLHL